MRVVNTSVRKKDAMQLVTGQPVYVDDLAPQDCLIVKLLRSPYANAMVKTINTAIAMKVPGIEAIYTWEDVQMCIRDRYMIPRFTPTQADSPLRQLRPVQLHSSQQAVKM